MGLCGAYLRTFYTYIYIYIQVVDRGQGSQLPDTLPRLLLCFTLHLIPRAAYHTHHVLACSHSCHQCKNSRRRFDGPHAPVQCNSEAGGRLAAALSARPACSTLWSHLPEMGWRRGPGRGRIQKCAWPFSPSPVPYRCLPQGVASSRYCKPMTFPQRGYPPKPPQLLGPWGRGGVG